MPSPAVFAVLSSVLTISSYVITCRSIAAGRTKPHAFSWFIWFLLSLVIALAQWARGAGVGITMMLVSAGGCLLLAYLGWRVGQKNIVKKDYISLFLSFLTIPLWIVTKDPLASIFLIAFINTLGLIPTLRKSWHTPNEENPMTYLLFGTSNFVSIFSIESINLTTALMPAYRSILCFMTVIFLLIRRHQKNRKAI